MDYSDPERIDYAYQLEGWDEDWNYCGNTHRALYASTGLRGGRYTFRVKATNSDGVWTTAENYGWLAPRRLSGSFLAYRHNQNKKLLAGEKARRALEEKVAERTEELSEFMERFRSFALEKQTAFWDLIQTAEKQTEPLSAKEERKLKRQGWSKTNAFHIQYMVRDAHQTWPSSSKLK